MIGVVFLGWVSDKLQDRSKPIMYALFFSVGIFFTINFNDTNSALWMLGFLLFCVGLGIGGSMGQIAGAIASDLVRLFVYAYVIRENVIKRKSLHLLLQE
jgi:sugar phosphate permease